MLFRTRECCDSLYSFFFIISQYVPIKKPRTIKNKIRIVRQNPNAAKNIPITPATAAPTIPLFNFSIDYFIQFNVDVKVFFIRYIIKFNGSVVYRFNTFNLKNLCFVIYLNHINRQKHRMSYSLQYSCLEGLNKL